MIKEVEVEEIRKEIMMIIMMIEILLIGEVVQIGMIDTVGIMIIQKEIDQDLDHLGDKNIFLKNYFDVLFYFLSLL